MVRQNYPSAPLTLRRRFRPSQPSLRLLWPLLTSRSSLRRRPFRHEARYPQVRTQSFPAQPPNLRRLILDHKSFAVACPLALIGNASYPVLVHRLAVSIHTSFPQSVALPQLRFTSFAVVSLREDFHLQDCAHAGRTSNKYPPAKPGGFIVWAPQRRWYAEAVNRASMVPLGWVIAETGSATIRKPNTATSAPNPGPAAVVEH
jgi:hypothetical protein